jgi:hypothetical protein
LPNLTQKIGQAVKLTKLLFPFKIWSLESRWPMKMAHIKKKTETGIDNLFLDEFKK